MHSDDFSPPGLSPDEQREFEVLTRSLVLETPRRRRRPTAGTGTWVLLALGGVAMLGSLSVAPLVVPFLGFVLLVVVVHETTRRRAARDAWARMRGWLGVPHDGSSFTRSS